VNMIECFMYFCIFCHGLQNFQFYRGITCVYLEDVNILEWFMFCFCIFCIFCHGLHLEYVE
jgi:hypothetical protein